LGRIFCAEPASTSPENARVSARLETATVDCAIVGERVQSADAPFRDLSGTLGFV
jgi:hypothetical protein